MLVENDPLNIYNQSSTYTYSKMKYALMIRFEGSKLLDSSIYRKYNSKMSLQRLVSLSHYSYSYFVFGAMKK